MEKGMKPCCAAAAAAQLRYITVNGDRIGITNLDEILKRAEAVASGGERAIRNELLRLAKIHNYIPSQAEKSYEAALYLEYLRTSGSGPRPAPVREGGSP